MNLFEVSGFYGSQNTPCTVFCAQRRGVIWYAVDGSQNVNLTRDAVEDGVNVETLQDIDVFTYSKGIHSLEDLEKAVSA